MEFVRVKPNQNYVLNLNQNEIAINKDNVYVMHKSWADNVGGEKSPANLRPYNFSIDASDKKILFLRSMGMGDFLFLSPLIKLIKDNYTTSTVDFAGVEYQQSILNMIPGITNVVNMPIIESEFESYDYHFHVSTLIEMDNQSKNVYDLYLDALNQNSKETDEKYKRPYIKEQFIRKELVKNNIIGIHPFANNPIRALEMNLINSLVNELINNGYKIIIFSSPEEMIIAKTIIKQPQIIWAIEKHKSMEETANLLLTCEKVIAVDSVIVHLAQAMNIPTVAIYGPFPSESRLKYYKNISIIDTNPDCRCCLHSMNQCPKGENIGSLCLRIDPETIINVVKNKNIRSEPLFYETEINQYNVEIGQVPDTEHLVSQVV